MIDRGNMAVDWGAMSGPGHFAKINRVELHYDVYGDGPPLLLIMGLGTPMWGWEPQVRAFSGRFKVIAFDNRGVGRSEIPITPFTVGDMAADAVGLLDHLGIARAHVMGASMGGFIAQTFALDHPDRVDRLVLACTSFGGTEMVAAERWVLQDLASVEGDVEAVAKRTAKILFSPRSLAMRYDELRVWQDRRMADPVNPRGFRGQLEACIAFDRSRDVSRVKARTLVIGGMDDILIPTENFRRLAARIPGAKLILYPDTAHGFSIEAAGAVNRDVLDFLTTE